MFKSVKKDLGNFGMPKPVFTEIYFEFYDTISFFKTN